MKTAHLLMTSVGRRTKLVEYFVREMPDGHVSTADCNPLAPGLYMTERHHLVPRIVAPGYIDHLLELCQREGVTALLSLIDPELELLAGATERFEAIGVTVLVSPMDACQLCFDKYAMYTYCVTEGIAHARTYTTLDTFKNPLAHGEVAFPVFVKPRNASASLHVQTVSSLQVVEGLFAVHPNLLIQEYLRGQELGVDVCVDWLTHEVTDIFIKEKLVMRAGETDKSRSVKRDDVFELIEQVLAGTRLVGPLDFDLFDVDGTLYLSEINPRFGGGYLHAYECGVNFPKAIRNNLHGQRNPRRIGAYTEDIYLLKHDTVTLLPASLLEQIEKS
jgi:carbamoyl-phosphate synthase large subunit